MGAFLEFCIAQRENCVESHRDFGRLIFTAPKLTNATGYLKLYVCAYRKGHTYGHQGGKAAAGGGVGKKQGDAVKGRAMLERPEGRSLRGPHAAPQS